MNRRLFVIAQVMFIALVFSVLVASAQPLAGVSSAAGAGGTGGGTPFAPGNTTAPASPASSVGTGFAFQGSLKQNGSPANGQFDFTFTLFDRDPNGIQIGSTITQTNVTVTGGVYSAPLDFGTGIFQGDGRWLEIAVRPANNGTYTTLAPRTEITAAPYAMSLMPGAVISGTTSSSPVLRVINSDFDGINGTSSNGAGVVGYTTSTDPSKAGVYAVDFGNGNGVSGFATSGDAGVYGTGPHNGVRGVTASNGDSGVIGVNSGNGWGVYGGSAGGTGVEGNSTSWYGVYGHSTSSDGVHGVSDSNFSAGVGGISTNHGTGVYGSSAAPGRAGWFQGPVQIDGDVLINGHLTCNPSPCGSLQTNDLSNPGKDPGTNSPVESADTVDLYTGDITTDAKGEALVILPSDVEALNHDFRYQLTIVGDQFAQARVSSKIKNDSFSIMTDKPNIEVSWQLVGIR
jgi:hypothetical protein